MSLAHLSPTVDRDRRPGCITIVVTAASGVRCMNEAGSVVSGRGVCSVYAVLLALVARRRQADVTTPRAMSSRA